MQIEHDGTTPRLTIAYGSTGYFSGGRGTRSERLRGSRPPKVNHCGGRGTRSASSAAPDLRVLTQLGFAWTRCAFAANLRPPTPAPTGGAVGIARGLS